jgi:hypothetical protein
MIALANIEPHISECSDEEAGSEERHPETNV